MRFPTASSVALTPHIRASASGLHVRSAPHLQRMRTRNIPKASSRRLMCGSVPTPIAVQPPLFSRPCSAGIQSELYDLGIDYKGEAGVAHVKMMVLECSPFGPSSALSDRLAVAARCPERPQ